jgi:hypothetical protein
MSPIYNTDSVVVEDELCTLRRHTLWRVLSARKEYKDSGKFFLVGCPLCTATLQDKDRIRAISWKKNILSSAVSGIMPFSNVSI